MEFQVKEKVIERLENDSTLTGYISDIDWDNNPKKPDGMNEPKISLLDDFPEDITGLHGVVFDVGIEVYVSGYGAHMLPDTYRAQDQVKDLLLSGFSFSDGSWMRKLRMKSGWDSVGTPDADTIHKTATFRGKYFSTSSNQAIQAN